MISFAVHYHFFFRKLCKTPLVPCGKEGEWNASESGHPYAFVDRDGTAYLFYQGSTDMGKTWYISRLRLGFEGGVPYVSEYFNEEVK